MHHSIRGPKRALKYRTDALIWIQVKVQRDIYSSYKADYLFNDIKIFGKQVV